MDKGIKRPKYIGNSRVQKKGRVYAFRNGVLMLRNISTPFLNALDVRHRVVIFGQSLCQMKGFNMWKHDFWFQNGSIMRKEREHFEPIKKTNWTIYIYIYTHAFTYHVCMLSYNVDTKHRRTRKIHPNPLHPTTELQQRWQQQCQPIDIRTLSHLQQFASNPPESLVTVGATASDGNGDCKELMRSGGSSSSSDMDNTWRAAMSTSQYDDEKKNGNCDHSDCRLHRNKKGQHSAQHNMAENSSNSKCPVTQQWQGCCCHIKSKRLKETKGRLSKKASLANVPSFRFFVPVFRFAYPPGAPVLVPSFRFLYSCSGLEHLPKPRFWKAPFCELPKRQINSGGANHATNCGNRCWWRWWWYGGLWYLLAIRAIHMMFYTRWLFMIKGLRFLSHSNKNDNDNISVCTWLWVVTLVSHKHVPADQFGLLLKARWENATTSEQLQQALQAGLH